MEPVEADAQFVVELSSRGIRFVRAPGREVGVVVGDYIVAVGDIDDD